MKTALHNPTRARAPTLGVLALLASGFLGATPAFGQGVVGTQPRMGIMLWGDDTHGQCQVPALPGDVKSVQIACGTSHTLAIRSDGLLVAWGDNRFGQGEVPAIHKGHSYIRIAASDHNLALRNDGYLQAWGRNDFGQCDVPPLRAGYGWASFSAGGLHSAALLSDGTIVCWGDNTYNQCQVAKLPPGQHYIAVAAGARHTVALRSDGMVVAWGDKAFGQMKLPPYSMRDPFVAVSAGGAHSLALTRGGQIFAWGSNDSGQCDVPALPVGRVFLAIAAGGRHNIALLDDGSVLNWGADLLGQCRPPKVLSDLETVRISAGGQHSGVLFQAPASDIQPICVGNSSATRCPCRNDVPLDQISGCRNSTGQGAELFSSGHSRLGADDLVFYVSGLPRTVAMVLQGAPRAAGTTRGTMGVPFGDGLLCLQSPFVRLGALKASLAGFSFPAPGGKSLSELGGIRRPTTAFYQVWYRDPQPLCKGDGQNWTNGLRVVWTN